MIPTPKKKLNQIKARIIKAKSSFGVFTDMCLQMDIDMMAHEQRVELYEYCNKFNVKYAYLEQAISKGAQ